MSSNAGKVSTEDLLKVCRKNNKMFFLRKQELVEIHQKLIEKFGGIQGLRDDDAL